MKSIFSILIILLAQVSTLAQVDSVSMHSISHGGNIGTYISGGSQGVALSIDYTIEKGKSLISLGPVFNRDLYIEQDYGVRKKNTGFNFYGAHCSYIYYPNDRSTIFNLFFQMDVSFFKYSLDANIDYYNPYRTLTKSDESYFESTLSYGIRINFLKHLYINNSIGLGIGFGNTKYFYDQEPMRESNDRFLTGLIKIGIGFKI